MSDTYYKPLKIAENIYHIYEPGNVYTTLIIGEEKALLIDTGYGFGDLAAFVRTLTDKPLEVVLTHGHTDHCGGNYEFPTVYMNLMDVPTYLFIRTVHFIHRPVHAYDAQCLDDDCAYSCYGRRGYCPGTGSGSNCAHQHIGVFQGVPGTIRGTGHDSLRNAGYPDCSLYSGRYPFYIRGKV